MGQIAGIARHSERRGPIERLTSVRVSPEFGVEGDRNGDGRADFQIQVSSEAALGKLDFLL